MVGKRQYTDDPLPRYSLWRAFRSSFKSLASAPLVFASLCIPIYILYLMLGYLDNVLFSKTPFFLAHMISIVAFAALCAVVAHILIQLFSMQRAEISKVHLDFSLFKRLFMLTALFLIAQAILIEASYQLLFIATEDMTGDNIPVKMILTLKLYEATVSLCLTSCYLISVTFLSMETTKSLKKTLLLSDRLIGRAILGNIICASSALLIWAPLFYLDLNLQFNDRDVNTYYTGTQQPDHMMPPLESSLPMEITKVIVFAAALLMTVGVSTALARQKIAYLKAKAARTPAVSS